MIEWNNLWIYLFGSTEWMGLDWGFWVSMGITALIVLLMNLGFWLLPPKNQNTSH